MNDRSSVGCLDLPHGGHGDDHPVEGGGDVGEARVLALLDVVSQAREGETSDDQDQDLTNQRKGYKLVDQLETSMTSSLMQ